MKNRLDIKKDIQVSENTLFVRLELRISKVGSWNNIGHPETYLLKIS